MYSVYAAISLATFIYGLYLIRIKPKIWKNPIIRVLLVAQLINGFRFIIRPISIYLPFHVDFACRMLAFLNNVAAVLPVNLCVYCVVYLQLVVIHKVSPVKRWPRVLLLSIGVILSLVPLMMYLVLSPSAAGVQSFCHLKVVGDTKQYVFFICVVAIWQYLPGVVGVISIITLAIHIKHTKRRTRRIQHESVQSYGPPEAMVQNLHNADMLNKTLLSIIWFPITPILSLWFNMLLFSIYYYARRVYTPLEYVNVVLLGLQSLFLAGALIANPCVRGIYAERRRKRKAANEAAIPPDLALPSLHGSTRVCEHSLDLTLGNSDGSSIIQGPEVSEKRQMSEG